MAPRRSAPQAISGADLTAEVVRVAYGDAVFSPQLAEFVLDPFSATDAPPIDPDFDALTQRVRNVLRLLDSRDPARAARTVVRSDSLL